ncbi:hypothetical protein [Myrmica rubra virus 5]|nr:hypothetical protein [Myrmica rubra virus 5]
MVPYNARNDFAVSAEGFVPLVECQYDAIQALDRNFTRYISKSMYLWYSSQHLYARLIAIKATQGEATYKEEKFLDYVKSENYPIHLPIDEYLRSIGDITDSAGTKYRLGFPVWPNEQGHFGRVGPVTHYKYETFPAPVVLSQSIREDFLYTIDQERNYNWNLSYELIPEEEKAGFPTKNLLGWSRSTTLTTEQRETLQGAGVDQANFGATNVQFQLNKPLFERVADFVRMTECVMKLSITTGSSPNGSVAQIQWQERNTEEEEKFSRATHYLESEVRQCGPSQEDRRITVGALIIAKKEQIGRVRSYSCYDFSGYGLVPDTWHNTRNSVYDYGRTDIWNVRTYRSAFTGKDRIRTTWLQKTVLPRSQA